MPTKRLPWFKVWVGATRHEKVATLSDTDFRTWVELLDAASQQNVRGKFDSIAGAAAVTRRPSTSIKRLVTAGLLDDRQGEGLWMHDWKEWQRWRPEDNGNDLESPPEPPTINTRSTQDQLTNVNGSSHDPPPIASASTHDQHAKDSSLPRADARARIDVEGEEELKTKTKTDPPAPAERPPSGGLTRPRARGDHPAKLRKPISDVQIERLVLDYTPQFGSEDVVRNWIFRALNHEARLKSLDEALYVERTWLKPELEKLKARASPIPLVLPGQLAPIEPDPDRPTSAAFDLDRVLLVCSECARKRRMSPGQTVCTTCQDMQASGLLKRGAA